MTDQPAPGGMDRALEVKDHRPQRLTRYSVPWVVWLTLSAVFLIPYEIVMVAQGREGGPLTHVVKWLYGPERSLRWWLLGCLFFSWSAWLAPHFMFHGVGLRALLASLALGLLVAVVGWLLTR